MENTRKMNIRIITTILGSLPDNTLVFSDKLPLTMSSKDGDKFEGNFDRMALECTDNGNCIVWFDELLSLFKDDNKQDFCVLRVSSYSSKV